MTQRVDFGPFSLDAPGQWTLSTVILSGPVEAPPSEGLLTTKAVPPFQRNVVTTMEVVGEDETAESFLDKQAAALAAANVGPTDTTAPETVTLGDGQRTGVLTERVMFGPRGEKIRQMQLVFIKDGVAFTAIASHLDGAPFERVRAEFRRMLLSYR